MSYGAVFVLGGQMGLAGLTAFLASLYALHEEYTDLRKKLETMSESLKSLPHATNAQNNMRGDEQAKTQATTKLVKE